jgi:hypothetical protein
VTPAFALISVPLPTLSASIDRTLFQRAVGNLIENSLAHTAELTYQVGKERVNEALPESVLNVVCIHGRADAAESSIAALSRLLERSHL